LVFTNPIPVKNLDFLYPNNYFNLQNNFEKKKIDLERWYILNQYKFDFKLVKKITGKEIINFGSYLDIGCGSGERVFFIKENGCKKSYGLDKYDNLKIKTKNFINSEIIDFKPRIKFDTVSLFHVLEHVDDFEKIIKHVKKYILKDNGYLIIQVPNYDSIERKLFKNKWVCFDVPRHKWHFDSSFFVKFFKKNGFKLCGCEIKNAFLHPVSIGSSLIRDIDIQRIWMLRKPFYFKILWVLMTFITMPFSFIESIFKTSSMLTLIFKSKSK
jgi:SAM-dependent methyltransferase